MRRAQVPNGTSVARAVARCGFGTRIAPDGWWLAPESPVGPVSRIVPISLLLVHGDAYHYPLVEYAHWLVAAARPPAAAWVEPGLGHAESVAGPGLLARIAAWSRDTVSESGPLGKAGTTAGSAGSVRMRA